jgi:hypothetical protein
MQNTARMCGGVLQAMDKFSCSLCNYSAPTYAKLCHHMISPHQMILILSFIVKRLIACTSTKNWSTFKVHVSRVHSVRCEDSFTHSEDAVEELTDCSDNTLHDVTNSQLLCATLC